MQAGTVSRQGSAPRARCVSAEAIHSRNLLHILPTETQSHSASPSLRPRSSLASSDPLRIQERKEVGGLTSSPQSNRSPVRSLRLCQI